MSTTPRLFWLGDGETALPCVARGPEKSPRATVIFAPPFAEEMNRCRRWLTLTSLGLAAENIQTLVYDLPGTGDSPMAFAHTSWPLWVEATCRVMAHVQNAGPLYLVGVRLGALIAAAAIPSAPHVTGLILAAPVTDGAAAVRGLLRAAGAQAAALLADTGEIEVAGYRLSKPLAEAIGQQKLEPLLQYVTARITQLDLSGHTQPWLQIEPEEADALASATITQLVKAIQA